MTLKDWATSKYISSMDMKHFSLSKSGLMYNFSDHLVGECFLYDKK
jgi:hypothetical protein